MQDELHVDQLVKAGLDEQSHAAVLEQLRAIGAPGADPRKVTMLALQPAVGLQGGTPLRTRLTACLRRRCGEGCPRRSSAHSSPLRCISHCIDTCTRTGMRQSRCGCLAPSLKQGSQAHGLNSCPGQRMD